MKNALFTAQCLVQPRSRHNVGLAARLRQQTATKTGIQIGFTLIELLVVIVIAGIMMSIALPNLTNFIANGRISSASNDLVADLMLARNLASSTNKGYVVLCPSSQSDATCATTVACSATLSDWASSKRIVFIDNHSYPAASPDGSCKSGDTLIKRSNAITAGSITTPTAFTNANNWISFNSYGAMTGAAGATGTIGTGSFKLCVTNATQCRLITVDFSGRPSVTKVAW